MKRLLLILALLSACCSAQILPTIVAGGGVPTSLYFGYGCNGTTTNTCTVGGSTNSPFGFAVANKVTFGANAAGYSALTVPVNFSAVDGTNPHFVVAVYADSAGVISSGAPLCTSSSTVAVVGWTEASVSGCGTIAASTPYWLAFEIEGAGTSNRQDAVGGTLRYHSIVTYNTWPTANDWGTDTVSLSIAMKVTAN